MPVVYTQPNCPPCNAVKRWLTARGVDYEEKPATENLEYLASLGARSAPVVVQGTKVVQGFNPVELQTFVAA